MVPANTQCGLAVVHRCSEMPRENIIARHFEARVRSPATDCHTSGHRGIPFVESCDQVFLYYRIGLVWTRPMPFL